MATEADKEDDSSCHSWETLALDGVIFVRAILNVTLSWNPFKIEKLRYGRVKSLRDFEDPNNAWPASTLFNEAYVGTTNSGHLGKNFLRDMSGISYIPDVRTQE